MITEKDDVRIAEENLDCTFARDLNKLPADCYGQSDANLQTLLLQFFEFYAQFDFQNKAISVYDGCTIRKPNNLPLYIQNPLDQALNVSRNVSYEECERLKVEVRNAAWQLEGAGDQRADDWGIIGLIERKSTRGLKRLLRVGNSHRLLSVKDLFQEEEETDKKPKERLTEKSDESFEDNVPSEKEKKEPIKFKNSRVANEVYRLRRDKMV